MPELPASSPLPQPIFKLPTSALRDPGNLSQSSNSQESEAGQIPAPHKFKLPTLRLEIRDLQHAGAQAFLTSVIASEALATAVQSVLRLLYQDSECPTTTIPPTRSVTLIMRSLDGVAYTTGTELDSDHKEIHFSLDYIHDSVAAARQRDEIMGVLTHEMVHCYQYNGFGTCPGGLIEGIADWVRLRADLSPPHWKREATGKWDAGYQHTGYFLDDLEKRFGKGLVRRLNEKLRIAKYNEKPFWTELCGRPVEQLWDDYTETLKGKLDGECVLVEREDVVAV